MSIYVDNSELIDKIIEKCHKLRSALVQTILENDPLYSDSVCSDPNLTLDVNNLSLHTKEVIKAYLRGDNLTREDETLALNTLRNLSVPDLCKITNKTYSGESVQETVEIPIGKKQFCSEECVNCLKFVDCLRVSVKSLNLNETGEKKIDSNKFSNETFFVEYRIPDLIRAKTCKPESVRTCTRRTNKDVNFKQTTVHDIVNLSEIDLNQLEIKFQVSCRCLKQKTPISLGEAKFTFKYFANTKTFSCLQEQAIKINDKITVGTLLVAIQLGCGRLYFGKDFLNAIKEEKPIINENLVEKEQKRTRIPKIVLFGFVGVYQAEFYDQHNFSSFIVISQSFCNDSFISRVVYNNSRPVYNFKQTVPLIYSDELLENLHSSFIIVEFWQKGKVKDFLVGTTKLSLNQFFISFRNTTVVKYLQQKQFPVIGTDCWEPINNNNEEIIGQVELLTAVGTQEQINYLENERKKSVKLPKVPRKKIEVKTSEIGIQSDLTMEKAEEEEVIKPNVKKTSDLLDTLEKALEPKKADCFKVEIAINSALHLPIKRKKSKKRKEDLPSTYVTFEVNNNLKCTEIIPKNANPEWNFTCVINLPTDYLQDSQKKLIFKVWRKSTNTNLTPNYQTDVIIGFAALDLTVLASGLPSIQAWFNIVDFSGKTNGQVNIHVKPMENLIKFQKAKSPVKDVTETNELLSKTLKRKFTELDEITQRLRLRLSKVTEESEENDEMANQFERDINTLCVEEDFDMINFTDAFSANADVSDLLQTNRKIDLMLDKLNLTSEGSESSLETVSTTRYVSGCSTSRLESTEDLMEDLERDSRPNIHTFTSFNKMMDHFYGALDEGKEANK